MKGSTFYFIFILLFVIPITGISQQVNPFELREGKNDEIVIKRDSSSLDTGNYIIKVIEDTLQKPVLGTDDELPKIDNLSEIQTSIEETVEEEIVEEETSKEPVNPFNLLNDTISTKDLESENVTSLDQIDMSASIDTLKTDINIIEPAEPIKAKPPVPKGRNLIVFWLSLFCGLLIAISINSKRNILSDLSKSVRNLNFMKLLQKEQRNGWSLPYILFYLVFLLNITIFVRFLCIHFELPLFGYSYLHIGLFIFVLLAVRHISLYIISFMRKRLNEPLQYNFIIITSHILTGLVLIPINLFIAFSSPKIALFMLYMGIGILFVAYLSRWFRAFLNSLRIIIGHSFHFLLYLCSCEIVPILILIGYLRNLIS